MKIRKYHPILDRMMVIFVLLGILSVLGMLAQYLDEKNNSQKISTIKNFIQTALKPVGTTMYVWGGGWNDTDNAAGTSSTHIGLSPQWKLFFEQQTATYDFEQHKYERENGLDCSGYVGWAIYNTFEKEDGQEGYVIPSTIMAENFANRGWGTLLKNPTEFLVGDIVSMEGHVWICLGTCTDGSVLLVHSSPPGVSVCGTQIEGYESSMAIELATAFMNENYPNWQEKYPNCAVPNSYLQNVSVMRWNTYTMTDAEEVQKMSGENILANTR